MKKIFLFFSLTFTVITIINFVLPSHQYHRSDNNFFPDSIIFKPHEVYPEFWIKDLNEIVNQVPLNNSYPFTNSLYTNINISRDTFPQNEPSVKISRKNPNIVVAAWRDFRTGINPPIRRIGYSRSTDGGITWNNPSLAPPYDSVYPLASDPAVCTDTTGNFFISTISLNLTRTKLRVVVYKSSNEGLSFENPVNIAPHSDSAFLDDKEYITCDLVPNSPYKNNLYVTWSGGRPNIGGILFSKSSNSGNNWSEPICASHPGSGTGSVPVVGLNGEIYVVWFGWSASQTPGIYFNKSTNGGNSFSSDFLISQVMPSTSGYIGRLPSIAVDLSGAAHNGYIYTVWSDTNSYGDDDVFMSYSSNRGNSWSPRKRINDDSLTSRTKQYWPWITVNEAGNIYIIFFDTRNTHENYVVESFLAYSTDGGQTFINEVLGSQQFSTYYQNPEIRFGDYIGIDSWHERIVPVWTDQRAGLYNQEIYTAVIRDSLIGIKPIAGKIPNHFNLYQNYPNPFNPVTIIKFEIPKRSSIILEIFDILGRKIETPVRESLNPGTYEIKWNANNNPSGVYFYRLSTPGFSKTGKMIFLK